MRLARRIRAKGARMALGVMKRKAIRRYGFFVSDHSDLDSRSALRFTLEQSGLKLEMDKGSARFTLELSGLR